MMVRHDSERRGSGGGPAGSSSDDSDYADGRSGSGSGDRDDDYWNGRRSMLSLYPPLPHPHSLHTSSLGLPTLVFVT